MGEEFVPLREMVRLCELPEGRRSIGRAADPDELGLDEPDGEEHSGRRLLATAETEGRCGTEKGDVAGQTESHASDVDL